MSLTLLHAFLFAQGAVAFGLATYYFAMHISVPEWQRLPMVQDQLRKYSTRRLKFGRIYVRIFAPVMLLATAVCLAFAGFNAYESAVTPNARLALSADLTDAMQWAISILAIQAFLVVACFLQLWRGRRVLRKMALQALQTQKTVEEGAGQVASPSSP